MQPSPFSVSTDVPVDDFPVDPPVMVSMCDQHVVISPSTSLDLAATEVLVGLASSAVREGSIVMIDLDPSTPSDDLVSRGPVAGEDEVSVAETAGTVRLLGPGCVRLTTREAFWTIDLSQSRMFRSEKPVDPYFVAADGWTRIRALWASCASVTALTVDGTYLSCRAAWTVSARSPERGDERSVGSRVRRHGFDRVQTGAATPVG